MKRRLILLLTISLWVMFAIAQVKISGVVVDYDTKQIVEYASLSLFKQDSSFVAAASSDDQGLFAFNNIPSGNYLLSASSLGYEKAYQHIAAFEKEAEVGKIFLAPSSITLHDVSVTAQRTIQKVDRKLILPTAAEIRASDNGITLLRNLQLSRIVVNPIDNTVTVPGGGVVQLRINGVEVTAVEIAALSPSDIIRIEYHENPGMRYGDAAAVLDYIVRRRETGGSLSADLGNSYFQGLDWGENEFGAKMNNKKSEFSVNAYWSRRGINWFRENTETFVFPDHRLQRSDVGQPTRFQQQVFNGSANYNLNEPDKYMLNVRWRNNYEEVPHSFSDRSSLLYSSDNSTPLAITDQSSSRSNIPALDIYFQRNLSKDQLLIFNLVGTYIDSRSLRTYKAVQGNDLSTDIFSRVDGQKYSLIAEGIYEKTMKAGKFLAGLKHSQSFTNNVYSGNVNADVNLHVAETYIYSECQLGKGKFNYTFGMGITRTFNSQESLRNESYILRPTLRVNYQIDDKVFIRYGGSVLSTAPSLSDLNNVEQAIDSLQVRRGNPDLHTVWHLSNQLNAGYRKGVVDLDFFANYLYYNQPMMEQVSYEGDKFVRMVMNQKALHHLYTQASISLKPWKEYITLKYTPEFNRFVSKGNDYTHTFSYWRMRVSVNVNYKYYFLGADIFSRWDNLWGEDLQYGEKMHILSVGCNKPKWGITAMFFNPFSKRYDQSADNLSKLAPSSSYVYTDNLAGTFVVRLSINMNFGRKFKEGDRRVNNDDSDSGIMSGAKK